MITKTESRQQKTEERVSKKPADRHKSWANKRATKR